MCDMSKSNYRDSIYAYYKMYHSFKCTFFRKKDLTNYIHTESLKNHLYTHTCTKHAVLFISLVRCIVLEKQKPVFPS